MKKAKIALTTIVVIAVASGVLAHKAQRGNEPLYVCNTGVPTPTCSFAGLIFPNIPVATVELGTFTTADIQGLVCTNNGVCDCTSQIEYDVE